MVGGHGLRLRAARLVLALGLAAGAVRCAPAPGLALDAAAPKAAPRGYIAFCTRDPDFCDGAGPASVALTPGRWAELIRVNDALNRKLRPGDDRAPVGTADDWELPTGATANGVTADCEDYVLAKKAQLVALGWPKSALRIGVVEFSTHTPGLRHAVLLADTSGGVFVLDNLTPKIVPWTEARYEWVSVQVSTDPDRWEGVSRVSQR